MGVTAHGPDPYVSHRRDYLWAWKGGARPAPRRAPVPTRYRRRDLIAKPNLEQNRATEAAVFVDRRRGCVGFVALGSRLSALGSRLSALQAWPRAESPQPRPRFIQRLPRHAPLARRAGAPVSAGAARHPRAEPRSRSRAAPARTCRSGRGSEYFTALSDPGYASSAAPTSRRACRVPDPLASLVVLRRGAPSSPLRQP